MRNKKWNKVISALFAVRTIFEKRVWIWKHGEKQADLKVEILILQNKGCNNWTCTIFYTGIKRKGRKERRQKF